MSEEKKDKDIIMVNQTMSESIASDAFTFAAFAFVVWMAWLLDSNFLAVFGACLWFISILAKGQNYMQKRRKTPQEAADYLKSEYGVTAK